MPTYKIINKTAINNFRNADSNDNSMFSIICENATKGAYIDSIKVGSGVHVDSLAIGCSDKPGEMNMHGIGGLGGKETNYLVSYPQGV